MKEGMDNLVTVDSPKRSNESTAIVWSDNCSASITNGLFTKSLNLTSILISELQITPGNWQRDKFLKLRR